MKNMIAKKNILLSILFIYIVYICVWIVSDMMIVFGDGLFHDIGKFVIRLTYTFPLACGVYIFMKLNNSTGNLSKSLLISLLSAIVLLLVWFLSMYFLGVFHFAIGGKI